MKGHVCRKDTENDDLVRVEGLGSGLGLGSGSGSGLGPELGPGLG